MPAMEMSERRPTHTIDDDDAMLDKVVTIEGLTQRSHASCLGSLLSDFSDSGGTETMSREGLLKRKEEDG